ncbi:hypothetical protein [Algoriphagus sediminis]|uniref:Uncharacterized protein n=1 Tax=Algoriphagus sediminis TaxID=3057113 RepID=A0ABT7YD73_9BACT|nr:hypothetical protein [Algoriphagus sediminis]MDN3204469.1 hypothetical protein [Algoriphagus sediminis]
MKKILVLFFLLLPFITFGQTFFLDDIVQNSSGETLVSYRADENGGRADFKYNHRSGCLSNYSIVWTFSKSLNEIRAGESFNVNLKCDPCNSACGYKWRIASVSGANNILSVPGFPGFVYNENIREAGTSQPYGGIYDYYDEPQLSNTYTLEFSGNKQVPYQAFAINIAQDAIVYVFGQNGSSQPASTGNCHSLFGLGRLVSNLEVGSYEGYPNDWMIQTVDYALDHVRAVGCVDATFLSNLKSRLSNSSDTRTFYEEIRNYNIGLESEIKTSCAHCGNCN